MTNTPQAKTSFDCLTGVRGFAALWVVGHHQQNRLEALYPDLGLLHLVLEFGWLGVDIFCLLSGFIISYAYSDQLAKPTVQGVGRFLWLRVARTWPLHLFVMALFVAAFITRKGFAELPQVWSDGLFWSQLFLVHGWGFTEHFAWNTPSWTLSAEWFWYLMFPLFAIAIVRVNDARLAFAMTFVCIGATGYLLIGVLDSVWSTSLGYGIIRIGGEMFAGCFLYRAWKLGFYSRIPYASIGVVVILVILVVQPGLWIKDLTVVIWAFALLVLGLAYNEKPFGLLLGNRVSVFLGEISYSIYMTHWLLLGSVGFTGYIRIESFFDVLWVNAAILVLSTLTYMFVEKPARRYLRGKFRPAGSAH